MLRTRMPFLFLALALTATSFAQAPATPHQHDKFVTQPTDISREFAAFTVSFDGNDDEVALGVPEWVAYELKAMTKKPKSNSRPSRWSTDEALHAERIAPNDSSYRNSGYSRGHMCMKSHASRMGPAADRETHTVLNACPQMQSMNAGVWLAIENLTGTWANENGSVWIVTGPIFTSDQYQWIGDRDEVPVAVPDAFFKIVARQKGDVVEVLAFIVPMNGDSNHGRQTADVRPYLTSVDIIEALTGLDFLTALPDPQEKIVEQKIATQLWNTQPSRRR